MSRAPWLGRPTGRHAAGGRGRGRGRGSEPAPGDAAGPVDGGPAAAAAAPGAFPAGLPGAGMLGAPVMADAAVPGYDEPLVSPVTDAAREASAWSAALLPAYIPSGADPLVTINALGRKCPIPIILLAQQIHTVPVSAVIAVLADDPAAYPDIPAWCGLKSHDCVFRVDYATGWSFGIRRRY